MLLVLVSLACNDQSGLNRVKMPPTLWIDSPAEEEVLRQSDSEIALLGRVADEHDLPEDLQVTWVLDGGDPVDALVESDGTVHGEIPGDLALGEHQLVLQGLDQDGEAGRVVGHFTMAGPPGAPVVDLYAPDDGTVSGIAEDITFRGRASDTSTDVNDLFFEWFSDLDGTLSGAVSGSGESILITGQLTEGEHLIRLSVTDLDGEVGTDSIRVTVEGGATQPEPGDLIFSEFMVNPQVVPDEDGEWVELYNTSGRTLDIAGYSFHDDATDEWVFDASVLVPPHGYMVLCANMNPRKNGGVSCDGWFYRQPMGEAPPTGSGHGSGVAIANNDDELELTAPDGTDIDLFDYNDTNSDPIEDAMSFGLDPSHMNGVDNDDVGNWCVQTTVLSGMTEAGTPGQANDPCF